MFNPHAAVYILELLSEEENPSSLNVVYSCSCFFHQRMYVSRHELEDGEHCVYIIADRSIPSSVMQKKHDPFDHLDGFEFRMGNASKLWWGIDYRLGHVSIYCELW